MSKGSPVSVTKAVSYLSAMSGAKKQRSVNNDHRQKATQPAGFAYRPARRRRIPRLEPGCQSPKYAT